MRLVTYEEYLEFARSRGHVVAGGARVELGPIAVSRLSPTEDELADVSTTVWSFPVRGSWATHRGDYRGNWAPQIPRALILRYTEPGATVLDPMVGSGTTCVEAKLLGRNCIGVDIDYGAVVLTLHRLYHLERAVEEVARRSLARGGDLDLALRAWAKVYHGDARRLSEVEDGSVDLVATHPPYWNAVEYGSGRSEGDLSRAGSLEEYLGLLGEVAGEVFRVLRPGGVLGVLVGDMRVRKHYVPVSHYVLDVLLGAGFILMEEVVKVQHKMKATREVWSRLRNRDFLLIYHEKLYVLRKPASEREYEIYRYSAGRR